MPVSEHAAFLVDMRARIAGLQDPVLTAMDVVLISAQDGRGLDTLKSVIARYLFADEDFDPL